MLYGHVSISNRMTSKNITGVRTEFPPAKPIFFWMDSIANPLVAYLVSGLENLPAASNLAER
jgi:hypothetical protein